MCNRGHSPSVEWGKQKACCRATAGLREGVGECARSRVPRKAPHHATQCQSPLGRPGPLASRGHGICMRSRWSGWQPRVGEAPKLSQTTSRTRGPPQSGCELSQSSHLFVSLISSHLFPGPCPPIWEGDGHQSFTKLLDQKFPACGFFKGRQSVYQRDDEGDRVTHWVSSGK